MGRASTFSNPTIIKLLQHDFVPVAVNVAHLVPEDKEGRNWCEASRFAESIVLKSGLRKQQNGDAQGYYALSAAGDFYGGINDDQQGVLQLLQDAKKAFIAKPPAHAEITQKTLGAEAPVPDDAAVLRVFSRIAPLPPGLPPAALNGSVGRDQLWLTHDECEALIKGEFPPALAQRIARYCLVDNVRGEPDHWQAKHIKKAEFHAVKSGEVNGLVQIKIDAEYAMARPARLRAEKPRRVPPMNMDGTLAGYIDFDARTHKISAAKLYASAEVSGESTFTPGAPKGKFPLKLAFVLSADPLARQIAPQGLMDAGREGYLKPQ